MKTRWTTLACFVLAIGLATAACGGEETFTGEPTGTIAFTSDRDGIEEIYTMNGDGSEQVNISNNKKSADSEPWWSPDGSQLAFQSFRAGPANIFVMNGDGSEVQQLTEHEAVEGGVRWSPDGSRIAFYSFRRQKDGLMWVMSIDDSDPQPVLQGQEPGPEMVCGGGFPGGWFPDGQRILFRGSEGETGALQICSVKPDGSDIKVIHSESGVMSYFPTLSPDGRKIAFTSDRDGNLEIYVMNSDGSGLRRLTDDPSNDEYPTWSPDGQWIAFHSDRDGDIDIYIMRPNGSDLRQLTNNNDSDTQPSWSPE